MPHENNENAELSSQVDEVPSFGGNPDETVAARPQKPSEAADEAVSPENPSEGSEARDAPADEAPRRRRKRGVKALAGQALGLNLGSPKGSDETSGDSTKAASGSSEKTEKSGQRRPRAKKPNEKLDSVLPESVSGPAISMISECAPFEYKPGQFAVLWLDTDDIGGLSQKSSGTDKGSIIQAMLNDRISIFTKGEMLADDVLVIIPNDVTIQMMEEFSLLVKAKYSWCLVDTTSKSEFKAEVVGPAQFSECRDIALGEARVADVIDAAMRHTAAVNDDAQPAGATRVESEVPVEPQATPQQDVVDAVPASSDEEFVDRPVDESDVYDGPPEDEFGEPSDEFGNPDELNTFAMDFDESEFGDPSGVVEADADIDAVPNQYGEDELDEDDDDPEGEFDDDVITEDDVQDAVLRRFRDTRLDFEVTTEDFENVVNSFDTTTPFLPTETDARELAGGSWLADIIAAETDAGNGEIAALHSANLDQARALYVSLMSQGIVSIAEDMSFEDVNTKYGSLKFKMDQSYTDRMNRIDLLVVEETRRLDADFEKALESVAVAAAETAKVRYREENQGRLTREKEAVASRMTSMMSESHDEKIAGLEADRRRAMQAHIDALSTQSLAALTPVLEKNRQAELALAKEWSNRIAKVVDENLKADMARTETLQADLDRTDRIQQLTAAHEAELATKSNEYQRQLGELNAQLAESESRAQSSIEGLRASLQARIDEAEGNARAGQERIQALEAERNTITERMDERRESEVRQAKEAHAADITSFNQRWATRTMVSRLMWVVMIALVFLVGFTAYILGLKNAGTGFIDVNSLVESIRFLN